MIQSNNDALALDGEVNPNLEQMGQVTSGEVDPNLEKMGQETTNDEVKLSRAQVQALVRKYDSRYNKAEQVMAKKHKTWSILDKFDRGEQWVDLDIPSWIPKPVTNMIRFIRTLKRANLASAIPKATFYAEYPEDKQIVGMLQKAYNWVWDRKKVNMVIRRAIDRALLQGTSVVMVYEDTDYVGGKRYSQKDSRLFQGDLCIKVFPNTNFFPDPDAYRLDSCKWVETTQLMPFAEVKNNPLFKKYAGKQLEDLKYSIIGESETETGEIFARDNKIMNQDQVEDGDEMVNVHTHWEKYTTSDGSKQLDMTYYISGTDFFLYRIENVMPCCYPFAVLYDEEEEQDFWGTSVCMDQLENQKILNRLLQTQMIIGTLHQNPQKVIKKNSGINVQELLATGTLPGKVWASTVDNPIEIIKPMDIPRGLGELISSVYNDMREMVGISEAYTGQNVGSLTTSSGVDSLIERATIRDKDKMSQIDTFVEDLSGIITQYILFKWKDERPITSIKRNGQEDFAQYSPVDELTAQNMDIRIRSDVYAQSPVSEMSLRQQADKIIRLQGEFQFDPPLMIPEEYMGMYKFNNVEDSIQRMEKQRMDMAANDAQSIAQQLKQIGFEIQKLRASGRPQQEIDQAIDQLALKMVQEREMAKRKSGVDVAKPTEVPNGTGEMAQTNMTSGM